MEKEKIYAHYNGTDKQLLLDHLFNVARSGAKEAQTVGQENVLFLIGIFHDLGKASQAFQNKLMKKPNDKVDHSSAGAYFLFEKIPTVLEFYSYDKGIVKIFTELVCYTISAHHGIYDIPLSGANKTAYMESNLYRRMQEYIKNPNYNYEDIDSFVKEIDKSLIVNNQFKNIDELIVAAFNDFENIFKKVNKLKQSTDEMFYYFSLVQRLYLSLLKNADILDTINAYRFEITPYTQNEVLDLKHQYLEKIELLYQQYEKNLEKQTELNKIRMAIANRLNKRALNDTTGIYKLNLPTGAGKTKLSMRYGIHQINQEKQRFFYITPYLSVLEQNAKEIKGILGENGVLEHHSNMVSEYDGNNEIDQQEEDTKTSIMKEYLLDTWDSPVVLSTMVQFFQTLFKGKSANLRRFSNLINSVIILDEVQSLPVQVTTLFNLTVNFLKNIMNATVVLCTATQPKFDSKYLKHTVVYGGEGNESSELVTLSQEESNIFKRTNIYKFEEYFNLKSNILDIATAATQIKGVLNKSILIILNTKNAVKKMYEELQNLDSQKKIYHLSTNMCPKHRLDIIDEIRKKLSENEPIICVSTQLIEAGVDVDFDMVIRSYAGIDSIVQSAGRCNREGKKVNGDVLLLNLDPQEENLDFLKEIKSKKDKTSQIIIDKHGEINITDLNDKFFEKYYANEKDFDYSLGKDNESVYELLSKRNPRKWLMYQKYKTAADKMDLIQDESTGVIIYYGDAKEKIEELIVTIDKYERNYDSEYLKDIRNILQQLQPYTVNVRGNKLSRFTLKYLDASVQILLEDYYDNALGINLEGATFVL